MTDNAFAAAADLFAKGDGIDTLWNIENLRFCLGNDPVTKNCNSFTDVSVAPRVALSAASLAFGNQGITTTSAARTITVRNTGIAALKLTDVTVTGTDPGQFTATPSAGCASVAQGASCTVAVRFAPTSTGAKSATVNIVSNAAGSPHSVNVSGTGTAVVPNAPTNVAATVGNLSSRVTWTRPAGNGGPITSYDFVVKSGTTVISTTTGIAAATVARTVTGLTPGQNYTFEVRAVNAFGPGPFGVSNEITAVGTPAAPTALQATRGNTSASLSWTPGADNGSAITGYTLQIRNGAAVVETRTLTGNVSSAVISGLNNGTAYNFRLRAINGIGTSGLSAASNTVTPATLPGLVQIAAPTQGAAGGALTASANWTPPLSNGGANVTNYRVRALRMDADGTTVLSVEGDITVGAAARTRSFTLPAGSYRFDVSAINGVGEGPAARSEAIAAR